jgi:hypothetical protein
LDLIPFVKESLFVFVMLAGLSLAGGFVVLPFRKTLRFAGLAAPLAGLLVVVLGIASLYSISGRDFAVCAMVSASLCVAATVSGLILARPRFRWRDWLWPVLAGLAVVPAVTFATDATTIRLGRPGFLYMDGTDHLGYAHMADWLSAHPVALPPRSTEELPYEAFPAVLFRMDPRFGSFFSLALIRSMRGLSGTFSYDVACAVILSASILGVAGVFSRSLLSLLILVPGLMSCHWYDYSRGGYFGKLLGYPACLFVAGLFLSNPDIRSPVILCALVLLTAATALMHSGMVTAFFLGAIVGGYLLCQLLFDCRPIRGEKLKELAATSAALAMLIVVAVVATGMPAKPGQTNYPDWSLKWEYVLPRILDLENQGVSVASVGPKLLAWMTALAFAVWLALIAAAIRMRDSVAGGLLIGPFLLLLFMLLGGARAAAFQMIGTFYPFSICAAAVLIDRGAFSVEQFPFRGRLVQGAVLVFAIACVGLRIPRTIGSLQRYAGTEVPKTLQFSKQDADRLADSIGQQTAEVDVIEPQRAIFLLVELGRREGVHFQWSPRSWVATVGYAKWPAPKYATPAAVKLVASGEVPDLPVLFQSPQYDLIDRPSGPAVGAAADSIIGPK